MKHNHHERFIEQATQWFNQVKASMLSGKDIPAPPDQLIMDLLLHQSRHARLIIDIDLVNGSIRKTLVKIEENNNT